ncbi:methionine adenosyltransferase [Candidatus Enterococcus ikei]
MMSEQYYTSEAVTIGHPDKVCDQISDGILDAYLSQDCKSHVACEVLITENTLVLAGEITSQVSINEEEIARKILEKIGYVSVESGFDCYTGQVINLIRNQSPDIKQAVSKDELGAGDQGMMFGYATSETDTFLPLPFVLANRLVERLTELRDKGICSYLRPDGKAQVTMRYRDGQPETVTAVVISAQHSPYVTNKTIRQEIEHLVIRQVIPSKWLTDKTEFYINPSGRFIIGGPKGDTGLTGRKIIIDTYGGFAKHGGGAFSGKDPTKVDRSVTYMARYLAKNIVAAGYADRCEVSLSYGIGLTQPLSINIETFNTGKITQESIRSMIVNTVDLSPSGIIQHLKLDRPVYYKTASQGHFGKDCYTWEQIDQEQLFS